MKMVLRVDPAPAKAATKGIFVVDTEAHSRKSKWSTRYSSLCRCVSVVIVGFYPLSKARISMGKSYITGEAPWTELRS